jgi:hypothetical protein
VRQIGRDTDRRIAALDQTIGGQFPVNNRDSTSFPGIKTFAQLL